MALVEKVSTSSVRTLVDQRLEGRQAHVPIRSLMVPELGKTYGVGDRHWAGLPIYTVPYYKYGETLSIYDSLNPRSTDSYTY